MRTSKSNANPTGDDGARRHRNGPPEKRAERTLAAADRGPGVAPEERHRLAECCAFFKAAHYRQAAPNEIRKRDIDMAQSEIDAVLRHCGKD